MIAYFVIYDAGANDLHQTHAEAYNSTSKISTIESSATEALF